MEQNKIRTYLKYAIGEIALVMIGILLALQVNNWNDQIKADRLAEDYKSLLKSDFQKDTLYYNEYISYIKDDMSHWNNIKRRVSKPEANLDSLIKINRQDFNFFLRGFEGFNSGTYSTIDATGNWNVFSKAFIEDLTALNLLQISSKKQINIQLDIYLSALTAHGTVYPNNQPFSMLGTGPLNNYLWTNLDEKDYIKSFNRVTTSKATYFRSADYETKKLLRATEEILQKHFEEN